jgi:hypothetical protein
MNGADPCPTLSMSRLALAACGTSRAAAGNPPDAPGPPTVYPIAVGPAPDG